MWQITHNWWIIVKCITLTRLYYEIGTSNLKCLNYCKSHCCNQLIIDHWPFCCNKLIWNAYNSWEPGSNPELNALYSWISMSNKSVYIHNSGVTLMGCNLCWCSAKLQDWIVWPDKHQMHDCVKIWFDWIDKPSLLRKLFVLCLVLICCSLRHVHIIHSQTFPPRHKSTYSSYRCLTEWALQSSSSILHGFSMFVEFTTFIQPYKYTIIPEKCDKNVYICYSLIENYLDNRTQKGKLITSLLKKVRWYVACHRALLLGGCSTSSTSML